MWHAMLYVRFSFVYFSCKALYISLTNPLNVEITFCFQTFTTYLRYHSLRTALAVSCYMCTRAALHVKKIVLSLSGLDTIKCSRTPDRDFRCFYPCEIFLSHTPIPAQG